jgi:hypothetical protein
MDACPMIAQCHRHQYPQNYGGKQFPRTLEIHAEREYFAMTVRDDEALPTPLVIPDRAK